MTEQYPRSETAHEPLIRETYEEYDVADTRLAMIADPENKHAWIQSDRTDPIEP